MWDCLNRRFLVLREKPVIVSGTIETLLRSQMSCRKNEKRSDLMGCGLVNDGNVCQ